MGQRYSPVMCAVGCGDGEFYLPGGICIDGSNNLYVADEGNNRIQKLSNRGLCVGSFTWGDADYFISDVAYDYVNHQLLVPRACNRHGEQKN